MPKRPNPPWQPPPEIARQMPRAVSGNKVNGLDEAQVRRPTPIMWHHPKRIPDFASIQELVNLTYRGHPRLADVFDTPARREPHAAIAAEKVQDSPENWSRRAKAFALSHEADLVGISQVDPNWVFQGFEVSEPFVIVLGLAMDHRALSTAPEIDAAVEVAAQYNRGERAAKALANWIRAQGWSAHGHAGPSAGPLQLIPAALAAGFGELGKHGSIINKKLGSSFRLAAVLTELPLVPDASAEFGADDFCKHCQVCTNACPPDAILKEKRLVRGIQKWYVDFDRCMPYFAATHGCGICIAVCPWSTPGSAPRLADKMARRRARR
jgi:epoxyqueuosine reductase